MGCVLQPGEVNSVAALQPGDTTSEAVQPGQDIDDCFVAPTTIYGMSDAMNNFQIADTGFFGNAYNLYRFTTGGQHEFETNDDDGQFPPNFPPTLINGGFDWIFPKADRLGPETYHFRATQFQGDFLSGSPKETWLEIQGNGPFAYKLEGNSVNFFQASFTAQISLDGGATVLEEGDIILEMDITF